MENLSKVKELENLEEREYSFSTLETKQEQKESKKNFFRKNVEKLGRLNKKSAMYALAAFLTLSPVVNTSCGSAEKESGIIECNLEDGSINRFQNYQEKKKVVAFPESMIDRKAGKLFQDYLGIESNVIPTHAEVDYFSNMLNLWQTKVNRKNVTKATKDNAGKVLQTYYENKEITNLKGLQKNISENIRLVDKNLDKEGLAKHFRLDEDKNKILNSLSNLVSSENLLAYGMTELMPSIEDGKFNKEIMSFLLENAGENYILSIPALHDDYLSFGLYQFTSFAVKADVESKEGASIVNDFLPEEHRIPGSVSKLVGDDHHKAAYLFSIYNLARVIKQGDTKDFDKLLKLKSEKDKKEIITIYIATAHHLPAPSRRLFLKWLESNNVNVKEYINILNKNNEALKQYAIKTSNNLSALDSSYKSYKLTDFPSSANKKLLAKNTRKK